MDRFRLDLIEGCVALADIKPRLARTLEGYQDLMPADKDALILLKPNLNSNMNSLTGNTTDLRLLAALIGVLQDKGYTNIVIGEGTNSGFYRCNIGVIARLRLDAFARHFGVRVRDFNYAEPHSIEFEHGVTAAVARETVEAALFINLPKLKTHFENGMSVCLKNLMGCLIGQENKKKTHDDLPANILRINEQVKPHLHIVDAMICMEGLGPTKGTPVRLDTLIVGTDPFLVDLACARVAMCDYRKVRTLALAEQKGLLSREHHAFVQDLPLEGLQRRFAPPKAGPIATFIHSPKRQKFFLKIRNTSFFTYLASTKWFGHLLFLTNLRQDVFIEQEMRTDSLSQDEKVCTKCGKCADYCPMELTLPDAFRSPEKMEKCITCLYCFCVCPQGAIEHHGDLGFMAEQIRQYDKIIRRIM